MKRSDILTILDHHQEEIRQRFGVKFLALFGSVARDEAAPGSDIDFLVEFDEPHGYFHLFHFQDFLQALLGGTDVDLVLRSALIDDLKDIIEQEAIHVVG